MQLHCQLADQHATSSPLQPSLPPRARRNSSLPTSRDLRRAADHGDLPALRRAINEGAQVDRLDCSGFTALHLAAEKGHVEIVEELLHQVRVVAAGVPALPCETMCLCYGVATVSRIDQIIGLLCRISSFFIGLFCKRDIYLNDLTNLRHPIHPGHTSARAGLHDRGSVCPKN